MTLNQRPDLGPAVLTAVSAHGTQGLRRAWHVRCEPSAPWASERAALRLRRVRCPVDRYRATARHPPPPSPGGGDIVNRARDSFHPRWQPTSAFALKTLKVGIAEIPSSDPIPRTSSVLNFAKTHDLAEMWRKPAFWAVPRRLQGCTAGPERPENRHPGDHRTAVRKREGAWSRSWLCPCACRRVCAAARMNRLHYSAVYSSLILAYTGAAALHGGHQVA